MTREQRAMPCRGKTYAMSRITVICRDAAVMMRAAIFAPLYCRYFAYADVMQRSLAFDALFTSCCRDASAMRYFTATVTLPC